MLLRLLFRPLLLATVVLLVALIAALRLQSPDDAALRDFLLPPPGCESPCWLGIRPGVTATDDALAVLGSHDWIKHVSTRQTDSGYKRWYEFSWSGTQPDFVDARKPGILNVRWLSEREPLVESVEIPLRLPLGDLYRAVGEPTTVTAVPLGRIGWLATEHLYGEPNMIVRGYVPCPLSAPGLLGRDELTVDFGGFPFYPDSYSHWSRLLGDIAC